MTNGTNHTDETPQMFSAALLLREDGKLLLVRHRSNDAQLAGFAARWSLPMQAVAEDETAEHALQRVLRERLHVEPGALEFAETISGAGRDSVPYVANVFRCTDWRGEPRFGGTHYDDAAWVRPADAGRQLDLAPELQRWLRSAFDDAPPAAEPAALSSALEKARDALLAAFEAIPAGTREQQLAGGLSPLDVLALAAGAEAYQVAETRRLLETPGHNWREFNEAQWEADHRSRPPQSEAGALARLDGVRGETLRWLETLSAEQIAAYGNHPQRGAVTVTDCIEGIARQDRGCAARLRTMLRTTGGQGGAEASASGEEDAAADR